MCFSRSRPLRAFSDAATADAAGAGGVRPWALDVPCMQSPSPATNRKRRRRVLKIISPVMIEWAALNYTENPSAPPGHAVNGVNPLRWAGTPYRNQLLSVCLDVGSRPGADMRADPQDRFRAPAAEFLQRSHHRRVAAMDATGLGEMENAKAGHRSRLRQTRAIPRLHAASTLFPDFRRAPGVPRCRAATWRSPPQAATCICSALGIRRTRVPSGYRAARAFPHPRQSLLAASHGPA